MLSKRENDHIELISAAQMRRGFNAGSTIVYRDTMRTGLALAFTSVAALKGRVDIVLGPNARYCVIGCEQRQDNDYIREAVKRLQLTLSANQP